MRFIALLTAALPVMFCTIASAEVVPFESDVASHHGVVVDGFIEWRSDYQRDFHATTAAGAPRRWRFDLPIPLPDTARVEVGENLVIDVERDENGRMTAFEVTSLTWSQPAVVRTTVPLGGSVDPPLLRSTGQLIELVGARIRPSPPSPLELRLGSVRHRDVPDGLATKLRRMGQGETPVMVIADARYVESGGLGPYIVLDAETRETRYVGVAGAFVVVLTLLGGLGRVVVRAAEREGEP